MKTLGIIPARFASTRFPGKPLALISGRSMIERVYTRAKQATLLDELIIATDDDRIVDHVQQFGGRVMLTRADHPSGTDRCAEVAAAHPDYELVVNIQGDEPFVDPEQIDDLVSSFQNPAVDIATLARPIGAVEELFNANVVKVVWNDKGQALYFSRQPIPFLRSLAVEEWLHAHLHYQHLGLYAYRRDILLALSELPPGRLERAESLEQLRWLSAGYRIQVLLTEQPTIGVDVPEDVDRAEAWLRNQ